MARTFDTCPVSEPWWLVLDAARRDGVRFRVNSGRRTFAEQQRLYDLWRAGNGAVAAVPSHTAPHIRTGRDDHALDVDQWFGDGIVGLRRWLRKHGIATSLPVPGEGWHLEVDSVAALRALAERLRPPRYTDRERRLLGKPRTRANRLALRAQARAIQLAARKPRRLGGGWDRHDRGKRFRGLRKAALR